MFQWGRQPESPEKAKRETLAPDTSWWGRERVSQINTEPLRDPEFAPTLRVGPVTAIKLAVARRNQLEGRASRSEYMALFVWGYAWVIVGGGLGLGAFMINEDLGGAVLGIFFLATIGLMIGAVKPYSAVTVRRLHDTGRYVNTEGLWRLRLWLFPRWGLLRRGDHGDNQFGPGPRSQ